MTVHFFYNYKDALVKELKEHFSEELEELEKSRAIQEQLDQAQRLIETYYEAFAEELSDVIAVAGDEIEIERGEDFLYKCRIAENYVKLTRRENNIEIKIGQYNKETDMVEATIVAYIMAGRDKRPVLRKVGKVHDRHHFDENTLNYYMRKTFHSLYPTD